MSSNVSGRERSASGDNADIYYILNFYGGFMNYTSFPCVCRHDIEITLPVFMDFSDESIRMNRFYSKSADIIFTYAAEECKAEKFRCRFKVDENDGVTDITLILTENSVGIRKKVTVTHSWKNGCIVGKKVCRT